jgi:Ion channel
MRDDHLQHDDDSSEREVQRNDGRRSAGSEPLDTRVPRPLDREGREAAGESKPDVGSFLDNPEHTEKQDTDWRGSGNEDRQFPRADRLEFLPVESMSALDAFAERVGMNVRKPDHPGGRCNDPDQLARTDMRKRARREGGHCKHRSVDRRSDPVIAASEHACDGTLATHRHEYADVAVLRGCEPASVSADAQPRATRIQSRLRNRAMRAVSNRRVFPYLVGVIACTSILTGLIAHLIDRKDFPSFGIGVWWATVTLGTVGYGDVVPHTAWGRVLGGVVIVCGVTFISFLIAIVTSLFIDADRDAEREANEARHTELTHLLRQIDARLGALEGEERRAH